MTFSEQYPHSTHKQDMMSEAEHWWNHLTFAQREFCHNYRAGRLHEDVVKWSYANKDFLHKNTGWPETPMRSV